MMNEFKFDVLEPFVIDQQITDINYNGKDLWIDHLDKGRIFYEDFSTHEIFMNLCQRFSNVVNIAFNPHNPLLESDFKDLRISIIHPSVGGRLSLSIRKTPSLMRLSEHSIVKDKYLTSSALKFLRYAIQSRCNVMISGMPGAGKTELLKFLTTYIPETERVISIEDSLEVRYQDIHPNRDCVSIKVNQRFTYDDAIKASLRQRPNWILVSEVRGKEVKSLMASVSTGTHLISTIHAKNAREIPYRMLGMIPDVDLSSKTVLKSLYETIDVGVHIDIQVSENGVKRFVREIVTYEEGESQLIYHYEQKKLVRGAPPFIKDRAHLFGVLYV